MRAEAIEVLSGTWMEVVQRVFPAFTVEECDSLLWEATAFPVADAKTVISQIKDWAARANDFEQVIYLAYGEMDLAIGEFLKESEDQP